MMVAAVIGPSTRLRVDVVRIPAHTTACRQHARCFRSESAPPTLVRLLALQRKIPWQIAVLVQPR